MATASAPLRTKTQFIAASSDSGSHRRAQNSERRVPPQVRCKEGPYPPRVNRNLTDSVTTAEQVFVSDRTAVAIAAQARMEMYVSPRKERQAGARNARADVARHARLI